MLGHQRPVPVSETPFNWRLAGGPMMARFKCYLDSLSPHKKKRCQSLAKLSGSAHGGLYRCRGLYMKFDNLLIFYSMSFVAVSTCDLGI